MRPPRWLAALGARLHPPRTVRLRLTLVSGGVVLVSGAGLLAIAFALGAHKSVKGYFIDRGIATVDAGATGAPGATSVAGAGTLPTPAPGGSVTIVSGRASGSGIVFSQVTRTAAQIGSSGAVHNLLVWSIVGLAIVTVLGLALGWVMSGRMLRPLRTMTNTTQHISEQNLHERLALAGPSGDELKELGDTIDGLLARLEAAFEAQGRFVQSASHELRTPLAMMRTSLEVATGKPAACRRR